ncbi:DUF1572 domain-containing protein [Flavobacteriaceae bacterium]|nr:DUF1572 domain-containing protein [Flavobacteriaceae bacterium]
MNEIILNEFKRNAIYRLSESLRMINIAFSKVTDELLWKRPTKNGMALGNQLLHSCGNMTQYIISSLGNTVDQRERELEFSATGTSNKKELLAMLSNTVSKSQAVIKETTSEDFERIRTVQGFELSGIGVTLHAVEHFSYHTGQIAFWIKVLTNEDLGFYSGQDLTIKNN